MSNKYKIFDGINWVNICDCNVTIKTPTEWRTLDPWNCVTKYWDGLSWCDVICCKCPDGYIVDPVTKKCYKLDIIAATPEGGTTVPIVEGSKSPSYGSGGTRLYEDISAKIYPLNGWHDGSLCPSPPPSNNPYCAAGFQVYDNSGVGSLINIQSTAITANEVFNNPTGLLTQGRLNLAGLWATGYGIEEWLTVEFCIDITETKTYIFAIAGDNQIKANITSTTFMGGVTNLNLVNLWGSNSPTGSPVSGYAVRTFSIWHMFPITLPAGNHKFELSGYDFSAPAAFAAEIYDMPVGTVSDVWPSNQTMYAFLNSSSVTVADLEPFILFSTKSLIQSPPLIIAAPGQTITWTCPDGYTLTSCYGVLSCVLEEYIPCNCDVYSNYITFPINHFMIRCQDTVLYDFMIPSLSTMTDLIIYLNLNYPEYGSYYDSGDDRVILNVLIDGKITCPCEDITLELFLTMI